jgi:hypothetical protein
MTNKTTLKKNNSTQEVAKMKLLRYLQRQKEQAALRPGAPPFSEADFEDEPILASAEKLDIDDDRNDWGPMGTTRRSSKRWWNIDVEDAPHDENDDSSDSEVDEAELLRLII